MRPYFMGLRARTSWGYAPILHGAMRPYLVGLCAHLHRRQRLLCLSQINLFISSGTDAGKVVRKQVCGSANLKQKTAQGCAVFCPYAPMFRRLRCRQLPYYRVGTTAPIRFNCNGVPAGKVFHSFSTSRKLHINGCCVKI